MQSLACSHIKGNLYWGKPAIEHIDEIKTIQAVCLVSHPEDKRCIIEPSDDDRSESEKFKKLDEFLKLEVMQKVNARYVYGVTATPKRGDIFSRKNMSQQSSRREG